MDLSVIIVSYNTKEHLRMTLMSVFASRTKRSFEVFVVDNASQDGSSEAVRDHFPQVHFIQNSENIGFSRANNMAIRQAGGKYILLLNSDVEIAPDTFDKMLDFMDNNPTVGVSGCRVVKPDGNLDLACRRSFPNPVNAFFRLSGLSFLFPKSRLASYNMTFLPEDQIAAVDSVMGAFLFIRRSVIDRIGLLDENFFMYGEDLDWCYRAKEAGFAVMYVPVTTVVHHKGSSSRKAPTKALYEFHRAMVLFYEKHYRERYPRFVGFAVKAAIWTRYYCKLWQNAFRREKYVSK